MTDDVELLRRYVEEGAEAAFAELVQRHLDFVYSAALRRLGGDTHAAADVSQQAFIALARKARQLAPGVVLPAWLYSTTRNLAVDFVRAEHRRRAREQAAHLMNESDFDSRFAATDWVRLRSLLDAAVDELGAREREAVLLRFFARRPFAEIGRTLGLSEDAARMRVDRALDKLRERLARRGVTSTSAALGAVLAAETVTAAPAALASAITGASLHVATGAAGPLAGVVQFMFTSKLATSAWAVAVLAVTLGIATHENRAQRIASAALVEVTTETAQLAARVREAQQRTGAAEQALGSLRGELAKAEARAAGSLADRPVDPVEAGNAFLARHPEARELWAELRRARLSEQLLPIHSALNLTPAQREAFENLMLLSSPGTTRLQTPAGDLTLSEPAALTPDEASKEARELLGAELYARAREIGRSEGLSLVRTLASMIYRTEPLSAVQALKLAEIFAQGSKPTAARAVDWDDIVAKATPALSPRQREALSGVQPSGNMPNARSDAAPGTRVPATANSSPASP